VISMGLSVKKKKRFITEKERHPGREKKVEKKKKLAAGEGENAGKSGQTTARNEGMC